jgi:hypothetical protein
VTIVASGVPATATKRCQKDLVGISLQEDARLQSILIAGIAENGLFTNSGLTVGQKVTFVNGQHCPMATADVIKLIAMSSRKVSIVAVEIAYASGEEEGATVVVVLVHKPTKDTRVGITLKTSKKIRNNFRQFLICVFQPILILMFISQLLLRFDS